MSGGLFFHLHVAVFFLSFFPSFVVLSVATDQFRRTNGALQEGGEREAVATSQFNGTAGMRGGQVRRRRGRRRGASGERTGTGRIWAFGHT